MKYLMSIIEMESFSDTNHAAEYRSISRIDHLEGSDRQIVAPKRSAPATDLITRRSAVPTSRTTDRDNSSYAISVR